MKAQEIRSQIASGFGIQFESGHYKKESQKQIAAKLTEADALIEELRKVADVSRAAMERDRRLLPEFASGVYMSPSFMQFRRRNGMLPGQFNGRDSIPAMLAPGEAVLNPRQIGAINRNAGFDVMATAGIPGYAGGGIATSGGASPINVTMGNIYLTVTLEQDSTGAWHANASSDTGVKVITDIVEKQYANDSLKLRRRGG